jgi:hypothetical protein
MSDIQVGSPQPVSTKHFCPECKREEPEKKVCSCGACMYVNTRQDKEAARKGYPIFICKCGKAHFWD